MEMIFCPLYSGSSGNCLFVQYGATRLLIDAGKSGKMIDEALDKIKSSNSIIEVNTGAMSRGWTDFPYPSKFILKLILEKNIPITLNSDVHSVENLDYYFDESMTVIKETGFKKIKILKKSEFQDIEVK